MATATETEANETQCDKYGNIGIALSGGGFRASVHGIGALMYIVDAKINKAVTSITSVSGGSITNAYIAAHCDFRNVDQQEFDNLASRFLCSITKHGLLRFRPVALYLIVLISLLGLSLSGLVSTWIEFWSPWISWSIFGASSITAAAFFLLRGKLLSWFLKYRYLADTNRNSVFLTDSKLRHTFAATDVNQGSAVFFHTNGQKGLVDVVALERRALFPVYKQLHEVVRASAAFPGAFPPKRIRLRKYLWGTDPQTPLNLFLADGGVWNNLGTDVWDYERGHDDVHFPTTRLVVNSGAPLALRPSAMFHVPFVAELLALFRTMTVLYENTVAPRTSFLQLRSRVPRSLSEQLEGPPRTAVIDLQREPWRWAWEAFTFDLEPAPEIAARRDRQKNFLLRYAYRNPSEIAKKRDLFRRIQAKWTDDAEERRGREIAAKGLITLEASTFEAGATDVAKSVLTTLSRLEPGAVTALLWHGYVSAMAGMHAIYDTPLLNVPTRSELALRVGLEG